MEAAMHVLHRGGFIVLPLTVLLSACLPNGIQVRLPTARPHDPLATQSQTAQPPVMANVSASPNPAIRDRSTTFCGSISGSKGSSMITKYNLEFGDGDAVIRQAAPPIISVEHIYKKAGTYVATLTDNAGETATVSTPIRVTED
jgi:PKD repeat protein